ncbi:STP1 protein [Plasmodium vivax]|uniref:STP1 protein n=1 Tax=Plasmodium vivax TaxID=5855 RepID=A0A565A6G5_PLAVI|nr:STP1 protein [Plasmodium vivax]
MPIRNKFKLDIDIPRNVKNNEKYKEISRRFQYALIEYYTNYSIEKNTLNTHVKCRNLNYFIDNLRDEFIELVDRLKKPKKIGKILWDKEVEGNILSNLQKETENSCPRNPTPYNKEIRILRKEMEDYCDERDELIGELNSRDISEKEKCDKFRRWTLEYLVNFWNDHFWRKYITYKALIEPFDINNMCSVITLFDNKFNCENDGDIRFHLPARIRDKHPKTKRNFYKNKLSPTITKDKIALEDTTPKHYVQTNYNENSTREVPQLGKSPEIPDTVFYPNISTGIQSTSVKVKDKQDSSGRNEYKEPFQINSDCSVITLFDNVFDCEDDGEIRLHLPAHIRDNYPTKRIYIPKEKVVPTNTNDKIALENKTPQSYVDTTYIENSTREVPELGKSPEITDTVFYPNISTGIQSTLVKVKDKQDSSGSPNISTGIQSTLVKVKDKQDSSGRNEYKGVTRVPLATYIKKNMAQPKAASTSLTSYPVTPLASSTASHVYSVTSSAPVQAISQSLTGDPSIPIAGGSSGIFHPIGNIQEQGGTLKTAPTSQIDQGNFLIAPVLVGFITVIFLLSKYTSFGLLFGNKKKERQHKKLQEIRLKPTHLEKTSNIIEHDNLEDTKHGMYDKYIMYRRGKHIYTPKKKRNLKKTIIDIHLEVLDECQKDQWELNKRDFQEIILDEFMKDANIVCKIRLKPTHLEKTSNIIEHDNLEDTKHDLYDKYIMYRRGKRIYTPKKKRNLKKTIIDIHLEVLDECQKDQWELNKRNFQEIILDEFMKDENIVCSHTSYNDSIITNMCNNEEIVKKKTLWVNWIERNKGTLEECKNEIDIQKSKENHYRYTLGILDECQKDQWELNKRDFQEIILDEFMKDANIVCSHSSYNDSIITNMCNSEEIGKEKILWVNWIERNKGTLEECKNEIWFNMLKSEWKQEQHIYLQKIEESKESELNERKNIPLLEIQKNIWRQWVAKQHKLMEMYSEKDWFMHLLKCVEEEPNELETENSNENVSLINLEELEKQKLYQQLYKKKQLIAA